MFMMATLTFSFTYTVIYKNIWTFFYREIDSKIFIFIKIRLCIAITIYNFYNYVNKYFFKKFLKSKIYSESILKVFLFWILLILLILNILLSENIFL